MLDALQNLHWTETAAVLFGLIYIVLAARENVWCWLWGIVSCLLWAWAAYYLYALILDSILQIFYVGMSVAGFWQWLRGGRDSGVLRIRSLPWCWHLWLNAAGAVATGVVGYFFDRYTGQAAAYLNAFTTVFSVLTTLLVVRKILENWLYWLVIDAAYIYLYISRGSFLFTILFMVYIVVAVSGYLQWRKNFAQQSATGLQQ
jgi:nicotinamide mononucleotide transporter